MIGALAVGAAVVSLAVPIVASMNSSDDFTWGYQEAPYDWVVYEERWSSHINQQFTPSHVQDSQVYFGAVPDVPEVLPAFQAVRLSDIDYQGFIPEIDVNYSPDHAAGSGFSANLLPEECYLVRPVRDESNQSISGVSPVLCYYFDLAGSSAGYYPVASKEHIGCCITIPPEEFVLSIPLDFSSPLAFLYTFGEFLSENVISVGDLFTFTIGGHSFFEVLFSTGFIVYMGWTILKWVIPA